MDEWEEIVLEEEKLIKFLPPFNEVDVPAEFLSSRCAGCKETVSKIRFSTVRCIHCALFYCQDCCRRLSEKEVISYGNLFHIDDCMVAGGTGGSTNNLNLNVGVPTSVAASIKSKVVDAIQETDDETNETDKDMGRPPMGTQLGVVEAAAGKGTNSSAPGFQGRNGSRSQSGKNSIIASMQQSKGEQQQGQSSSTSGNTAMSTVASSNAVTGVASGMSSSGTQQNEGSSMISSLMSKSAKLASNLSSSGTFGQTTSVKGIHLCCGPKGCYRWFQDYRKYESSNLREQINKVLSLTLSELCTCGKNGLIPESVGAGRGIIGVVNPAVSSGDLLTIENGSEKPMSRSNSIVLGGPNEPNSSFGSNVHGEGGLAGSNLGVTISNIVQTKGVLKIQSTSDDVDDLLCDDDVFLCDSNSPTNSNPSAFDTIDTSTAASLGEGGKPSSGSSQNNTGGYFSSLKSYFGRNSDVRNRTPEQQEGRRNPHSAATTPNAPSSSCTSTPGKLEDMNTSSNFLNVRTKKGRTRDDAGLRKILASLVLRAIDKVGKLGRAHITTLERKIVEKHRTQLVVGNYWSISKLLQVGIQLEVPADVKLFWELTLAPISAKVDPITGLMITTTEASGNDTSSAETNGSSGNIIMDRSSAEMTTSTSAEGVIQTPTPESGSSASASSSGSGEEVLRIGNLIGNPLGEPKDKSNGTDGEQTKVRYSALNLEDCFLLNRSNNNDLMFVCKMIMEWLISMLLPKDRSRKRRGSTGSFFRMGSNNKECSAQNTPRDTVARVHRTNSADGLNGNNGLNVHGNNGVTGNINGTNGNGSVIFGNGNNANGTMNGSQMESGRNNNNNSMNQNGNTVNSNLIDNIQTGMSKSFSQADTVYPTTGTNFVTKGNNRFSLPPDPNGIPNFPGNGFQAQGSNNGCQAPGTYSGITSPIIAPPGTTPRINDGNASALLPSDGMDVIYCKHGTVDKHLLMNYGKVFEIHFGSIQLLFCLLKHVFLKKIDASKSFYADTLLDWVQGLHDLVKEIVVIAGNGNETNGAQTAMQRSMGGSGLQPGKGTPVPPMGGGMSSSETGVIGDSNTQTPRMGSTSLGITPPGSAKNLIATGNMPTTGSGNNLSCFIESPTKLAPSLSEEKLDGFHCCEADNADVETYLNENTIRLEWVLDNLVEIREQVFQLLLAQIPGSSMSQSIVGGAAQHGLKNQTTNAIGNGAVSNAISLATLPSLIPSAVDSAISNAVSTLVASPYAGLAPTPTGGQIGTIQPSTANKDFRKSSSKDSNRRRLFGNERRVSFYTSPEVAKFETDDHGRCDDDGKTKSKNGKDDESPSVIASTGTVTVETSASSSSSSRYPTKRDKYSNASLQSRQQEFLQGSFKGKRSESIVPSSEVWDICSLRLWRQRHTSKCAYSYWQRLVALFGREIQVQNEFLDTLIHQPQYLSEMGSFTSFFPNHTSHHNSMRFLGLERIQHVKLLGESKSQSGALMVSITSHIKEHKFSVLESISKDRLRQLLLLNAQVLQQLSEHGKDTDALLKTQLSINAQLVNGTANVHGNFNCASPNNNFGTNGVNNLGDGVNHATTAPHVEVRKVVPAIDVNNLSYEGYADSPVNITSGREAGTVLAVSAMGVAMNTGSTLAGGVGNSANAKTGGTMNEPSVTSGSKKPRKLGKKPSLLDEIDSTLNVTKYEKKLETIEDPSSKEEGSEKASSKGDHVQYGKEFVLKISGDDGSDSGSDFGGSSVASVDLEEEAVKSPTNEAALETPRQGMQGENLVDKLEALADTPGRNSDDGGAGNKDEKKEEPEKKAEIAEKKDESTTGKNETKILHPPTDRANETVQNASKIVDSSTDTVQVDEKNECSFKMKTESLYGALSEPRETPSTPRETISVKIEEKVGTSAARRRPSKDLAIQVPHSSPGMYSALGSTTHASLEQQCLQQLTADAAEQTAKEEQKSELKRRLLLVKQGDKETMRKETWVSLALQLMHEIVYENSRVIELLEEFDLEGDEFKKAQAFRILQYDSKTIIVDCVQDAYTLTEIRTWKDEMQREEKKNHTPSYVPSPILPGSSSLVPSPQGGSSMNLKYALPNQMNLKYGGFGQHNNGFHGQQHGNQQCQNSSSSLQPSPQFSDAESRMDSTNLNTSNIMNPHYSKRPDQQISDFLQKWNPLNEVLTSPALCTQGGGTRRSSSSPLPRPTSGSATAAMRPDADLEKAKRRLAWSAASSLVYSFVLGFGDRHQENVMLTKTGIMFHIDFGFVLGEEPLNLASLLTQNKNHVRFDYSELYNALGKTIHDEVFWPALGVIFNALRAETCLIARFIQEKIVDNRLGCSTGNNASNTKSGHPGSNVNHGNSHGNQSNHHLGNSYHPNNQSNHHGNNTENDLKIGYRGWTGEKILHFLSARLQPCLPDDVATKFINDIVTEAKDSREIYLKDRLHLTVEKLEIRAWINQFGNLFRKGEGK